MRREISTTPARPNSKELAGRATTRPENPARNASESDAPFESDFEDDDDPMSRTIPAADLPVGLFPPEGPPKRQELSRSSSSDTLSEVSDVTGPTPSDGGPHGLPLEPGTVPLIKRPSLESAL